MTAQAPAPTDDRRTDGDIIEIARGVRMPVFGQPATTLGSPQPARTAVPAAYYLRLTLADKPGALAKVASVLGDAGISIDRMRQYGHHAGEAPVLIVTAAATTLNVILGRARPVQTHAPAPSAPIAISMVPVAPNRREPGCASRQKRSRSAASSGWTKRW